MAPPEELVPSEISHPTPMNGGITPTGVEPTLASTSTSNIREDGSLKTLPELNASQLKTTLTQSLRPIPEEGSPELWSFSACTDHMITVKWTVHNGWETPELKPYGDLTISPAASCLHYATQCFEGMKAYRGYDGKLRFFRPDQNCQRMVSSAPRVSLPTFDPKELEKLIVELVRVDGPRWLPKDKPGNFLYIRPALIGNGTQLGVQVPQEALLYVIIAPWPDLTRWKNRTTPAKSGLKLLASTPGTSGVRAWPGGFGHTKVGANYGPSFAAHGKSSALGYDQILWLLGDGDEAQVTEAGASNFFVVWRNAGTGMKELVTPSVEDGVILPGVLRRSVLELVRGRLEGGVEVVERGVGVGEVVGAWREGRLVECFVSGTAYFITPITNIQVQDTDIAIPPTPEGTTSLAATIKQWLSGIMYGPESHPWGVVVEEK